MTVKRMTSKFFSRVIGGKPQGFAAIVGDLGARTIFKLMSKVVIHKIEASGGKDLDVVMFMIVAEAKKSIAKRTGTPGMRYSPKRSVLVSRPGQAPNTDTGRLISSIGYAIERTRLGDRLVNKLKVNVKYGRYLEKGTSKMAARPFLRPAIKKHQKDLIKAAVIRGLKEVA